MHSILNRKQNSTFSDGFIAGEIKNTEVKEATLRLYKFNLKSTGQGCVNFICVGSVFAQELALNIALVGA